MRTTKLVLGCSSQCLLSLNNFQNTSKPPLLPLPSPYGILQGTHKMDSRVNNARRRRLLVVMSKAHTHATLALARLCPSLAMHRGESRTAVSAFR